VNEGPLVPLWIGLPLGVVTLVLLAGHVLMLSLTCKPRSRRSIRQANGVVGMLTVGLLCAGTCVFSHTAQPREWAIVWILAMMLLAFNVFLAVLDALNTVRLRRNARREMSTAAERLRAELAHILDRRAHRHPGARSDAGE
jgi:cytochrome bd-type quinol oxidase subunit 2